MFTGRPLPAPGEPLFTPQDTAAAVALAREEADVCPSCGHLKSFCRDPQNQFAFEGNEEMCFASWRLSLHRKGEGWTGKMDETRDATQLSAKFRKGHQPAMTAGLGID